MQTPVFWNEHGIAARLLNPASVLFGAVGRWRWRWTNPVSANIPVLCVGNLVAGGAGKTPVALSLASRLRASGYATHFLSRGYGGAVRGPHRVDNDCDGPANVGDEALLLAAVSPTWVAYGFGNQRLIPAGPLRESVVDGLARADAVVILGADQVGVREQIPKHLLVLTGQIVAGPERLKLVGRRTVAFAGIGRPEKFFNMLEDLGCELVDRHIFPDHHLYREHELLLLADKAHRLDAILVTTAKDAVRVSKAFRGLIEVLTVTVSWDDENALDTMLGNLSH